jgi:serine phosphatase RsbU (regulator of sigma subunit)
MASVVNDLYAFRLAVQRSEEKRLVLLLGLFGVVLVVALARHLAGGIAMQGGGFTGALVMLVAATICFVSALWMVKRANKEGRLIPSWIWSAGLCIEAIIPTAAIWGLIRYVPIEPLRSVAAPALLIYGIFAVATVLRLNPRMSFFYGVLSAAGHSIVIAYAVHKAGGVQSAEIPFLASYPVFLFLTGCMAAFVSGELRRHVIASLEAADLKRRTELLQGELRIAREIQQSLFPKQALMIPGFEVIGWCKPATETGGDYYDWCQLPSKEGFVMLGDATGHGLGPALLIASCRAYVRADLPQDSDIAGFMNRLNKRVAQDTDGSRLVTFVGTLLDEQTGQVKLVSAGHCPALLVRAAETVEQIKAHGVPLGVTSEFKFPDPAPIQLERGDRLLVYTDGITEAKDARGNMFGIERLGQAVVRHSKLDGQAFVDALYSEAMAFSNNAALQDDLTLLSIRRL